MIIQVNKKITNTDIKYKILAAGAKLTMPVNTKVTVIYEGKSYTAKTHSTTVGRIDGLSAFYKENSFNAGDELFVTYNEMSGEILIDKLDKEGFERIGELFLNSGNENTGLSEKSAEISEPDVSDESFDPDISYDPGIIEIPHFATAEKSELGIDDPKSWKNLHYDVTSRCCSPSILPAAANSRYIVFLCRDELVVYNRQDFTYRSVPQSFKDESLNIYYNYGGYILTENDTLYCADSEIYYKTDIHTGSSEVINRFKNSGNAYVYYTSVWKADDKTVVAEIKKEESDSYMKLDINGEIFMVPPRFVGSVISAGAGKLLIKGKGLWVFDVYTKEFTPLIVYAFSQTIDMNRKKEIAYEFDSNFFAVDFKSHTVAVRDFESLTKGNFKEGSVIIIRPDGVKRLKRGCNKEPKGGFSICCKPYRDCIGHEVGVDGNYYVTYKNPDGSFRELFYTQGSCVPEGFKMVDDHTAVVKLNDDKAAILDFAENCKFLLPLKNL